MGFLDDHASKPAARPPQITIAGDAGMGKTTIAASFPRPVFIRAEDGLTSVESFDVTALPTLSKGDDIWQQLKALLIEEHDFRTLVIDSVSALDKLFVEDLIEDDFKARRDTEGSHAKRRTINTVYGGYGAGFNALAGKHERVRRACDMISGKRRMNVVFLSHAEIEQIDLPDQEPYMRYTLRMSKKSISTYIDGVDLVGFLRLQTMVRQNEDKGALRPKAGKAKSTGSRHLICHAAPSNISKNRYGITEPLPVEYGVNPLAHIAHGDVIAEPTVTANDNTETKELIDA
jgi:hypothetical protein